MLIGIKSTINPNFIRKIEMKMDKYENPYLCLHYSNGDKEIVAQSEVFCSDCATNIDSILYESIINYLNSFIPDAIDYSEAL